MLMYIYIYIYIYTYMCYVFICLLFISSGRRKRLRDPNDLEPAAPTRDKARHRRRPNVRPISLLTLFLLTLLDSNFPGNSFWT